MAFDFLLNVTIGLTKLKNIRYLLRRSAFPVRKRVVFFKVRFARRETLHVIT